MLRLSCAIFFALIASGAAAQFVYPRPADNRPEPGLYVEDPFIVEYRKKFFAVFRGDFKTFEKAYAEIEAMLAKDPQDARALVWLGNGQTVRAGLMLTRGDSAGSAKLLATSRATLDRAVALRPTDPNIYMMRAATLYIQGQYWKGGDLPKVVWTTLRDDCLRFIDFLGDRLPKISVHVRGETYGELGIAYARLGDRAKARAAFAKVIELCPGTAYAIRAQKEIDGLASVGKSH